MPDVSLNFNFPIGPCRNPLKPYNHVDCVKEVSVWTDRSTTVDRLHSYHKQGHRVARANKSMPSSRKKTPPRSSNPKVQKHLNKMADMAYHRSKAAVHDVEMDCQLDNPAHARSAIGKTLRSSYKINSVQDATKTLASLLATLTNLADWKPGRSPRQNQPKVVGFLE